MDVLNKIVDQVVDAVYVEVDMPTEAWGTCWHQVHNPVSVDTRFPIGPWLE